MRVAIRLRDAYEAAHRRVSKDAMNSLDSRRLPVPWIDRWKGMLLLLERMHVGDMRFVSCMIDRGGSKQASLRDEGQIQIL